MNEICNMTEVSTSDLRPLIHEIRGVQVMLDRDLAALYGVPTKRLNEQVKRNIERFPEEFMFRLTVEESKELVANCDRFRMLKHSSAAMSAFTEQGVAMLSAVLKSDTAVIDRTTLIHIGASLNYLGKKCFGFSTMDAEMIPDILARIP